MSVFENENLISKILQRQHLTQDIVYTWDKLIKLKKHINYQIAKFNDCLTYLDSELPDNFINLLIDSASTDLVEEVNEEDKKLIKESFSKISEKIEKSQKLLFVSDIVHIETLNLM